MSHFAKDLTQGSVSRNLLRFALPLMLSTFLQALYGVVDMLVVGLFTDAAGISAVAVGSQITVLITNVVVGLAVGGNVLIAQHFGAKRHADVKATIGTMLSLYAILAVAITLAMWVAAPACLGLLHCPPDSAPQALAYLRICTLGNFFIFGYNAMSSVMRGLGDSRRPLIFVLVATLANVALDLLLVGRFRMGAAGAAWATIASQALSLVLSVAYLARRDFIFDFKPRSFAIDGRKALDLLRIGFPSSLQQLIVQMSFVFLTALINGYGVAASAAAGICSKVNAFAILPGLAMFSAVTAMAGQNVGAGRYDRALGTLGAGLKIIIPVSFLTCALVNLFNRQIVGLFSQDAQVLEIGSFYLRYLSLDALFATSLFTLNGLVMGAGKTFFTLLNSCLSSIVIRVPLAYIFALGLSLGMHGVGLATTLAPIGSLIVVSVYIRAGHWKRGAVERAPVAPLE